MICNVREQVKTLAKDPLMAAKVADGSILIVGGFYEISSGMVDFISMDEALDAHPPDVSGKGVAASNYMPTRKLSDHFERTPSSTPSSTPAAMRRAGSEGMSPAAGSVFHGIDDDGSLSNTSACLPCNSSAASTRA